MNFRVDIRTYDLYRKRVLALNLFKIFYRVMISIWIGVLFIAQIVNLLWIIQQELIAYFVIPTDMAVCVERISHSIAVILL